MPPGDPEMWLLTEPQSDKTLGVWGLEGEVVLEGHLPGGLSSCHP